MKRAAWLGPPYRGVGRASSSRPKAHEDQPSRAAWIATLLAGAPLRARGFLALPLDTVGGVPEVRHRFQEDLAELERQALGGLDLVIGQLDRALESLRYLDVELAGMVVADDDRIDGRYLEVHQGLLSLLARQAPVAGDLRIVAALLHIIRCIERMGDQCVNIAKLVPLSGNEPPKDKDVLDAIERMVRLTRSLVCQAKESFAERNVPTAQDLVRQDAEINRLNRAIFDRAVEIGDDLELREWAMFMVLVARAIERIADNTVDIAEQTAFVVTGLFREFTDASHVT